MTYRTAYEGFGIIRKYLGDLASEQYAFVYVDDRMQYDSIVNVLTSNDVKAHEIEVCLRDEGVELPKTIRTVAFVYVGTDYLSLLAIHANDKWDSRLLAGVFYAYASEEGESVFMFKDMDIDWIVTEYEGRRELFLTILTELSTTTVDAHMDYLLTKYRKVKGKLERWVELNRYGD